jgi:hypothetical protein
MFTAHSHTILQIAMADTLQLFVATELHTGGVTWEPLQFCEQPAYNRPPIDGAYRPVSRPPWAMDVYPQPQWEIVANLFESIGQ